MPSVVIEPVARLIEAFSRLPGIGPKTARELSESKMAAVTGGLRLPGM